MTNTKTNCDSDAQGEWGNFQGSRWRPKIQPWVSSISFFFFLLFFPSQLVVWPHQHCKFLNCFSLGGRFHTLLIGSKEKDFFFDNFIHLLLQTFWPFAHHVLLIKLEVWKLDKSCQGTQSAKETCIENDSYKTKQQHWSFFFFLQLHMWSKESWWFCVVTGCREGMQAQAGLKWIHNILCKAIYTYILHKGLGNSLFYVYMDSDLTVKAI